MTDPWSGVDGVHQPARSIQEPETLPNEAPRPRWQPWGAGWSLGITVCLVVAYFLAQFLVVFAAGIGIAVVQGQEVTGTEWLEGHMGFLVGVSTLVTAPPFVLLVVLAAYPRGSIREYLGLRWARWKPAFGWAVAVAAFLYGFDLLGAALGRPPIPDFMQEVYTTAVPLWVLWVALVVMAPLFEELLFRGFLIPGLEQRWGGVAAVLLSSGIFAVIHLQYDWFDMAAVLGLGLLFGAVRVTTGSTLWPMVLHAAVNLVATVQAHWLLSGC